MIEVRGVHGCHGVELPLELQRLGASVISGDNSPREVIFDSLSKPKMSVVRMFLESVCIFAEMLVMNYATTCIPSLLVGTCTNGTDIVFEGAIQA